MRILLAPDSFKESISARNAAEAMRRGVVAALGEAAEVDACPIADGGEGLVDAMLAATDGQRQLDLVTGPLGESVQAEWGRLGDGRTAVIELATAAGLALVPADRRDPTQTTTRGVGQLIALAIEQDAEHIILGIGGSGTNDAGSGAAQALGAQFFRRGQLIREPMCGALLAEVDRVDLSPLGASLSSVTIDVTTDVTNPLYGAYGAAHVYGPQKGATPEQVEALDQGLRHFATLFPAVDPHVAGCGAAGGFGFGALAMFGARLRRGIELVLETVGFDERVLGCDLCITGEGRLDGQTLNGKAISGVAAAARRHGVPVVALVGCTGMGAERAHEIGIERVVVIGEGLPAAESMARAGELLERAAREVVLARL